MRNQVDEISTFSYIKLGVRRYPWDTLNLCIVCGKKCHQCQNQRTRPTSVAFYDHINLFETEHSVFVY